MKIPAVVKLLLNDEFFKKNSDLLAVAIAFYSIIVEAS